MGLKLTRSDTRLSRLFQDPAAWEPALHHCCGRRKLYFGLGIAFAVGVMVASWYEVPFAYVLCLFFSVMFFIGSLHYDTMVKLVLLARGLRDDGPTDDGPTDDAPPD